MYDALYQPVDRTNNEEEGGQVPEHSNVRIAHMIGDLHR
jgi:hypothetical protein